MHGSYPPNILPKISKRKKDKKTFCLRFARMLDHFDQNPNLWNPQGQPFTQRSALLKLPAELRQSILRHILDDQTICDPRPSQQTQALALVCRTFSEDLKPTMKQWDMDEAAFRACFGTERTAMSAYIQDLMAPVVVAASALPRLRTRKKIGAAERKAKRYSLLVPHA